MEGQRADLAWLLQDKAETNDNAFICPSSLTIVIELDSLPNILKVISNWTSTTGLVKVSTQLITIPVKIYILTGP